MALNEQRLGAPESARLRKLGSRQNLAGAKELALSCIGARRKVARG
jgi:hypothetical protein